MQQREFKVQTFATGAQWRSGVTSLLQVNDAGLSLFACPNFDRMLFMSPGNNVLGDIVTDECGQTYWTALYKLPTEATARWSLLRYDPGSGELERLLVLESGGVPEPRRLWLTREYLFLLDETRERVLALSRENFQVVFEIQGLEPAVRTDFHPSGSFFALLRKQGGWRICRYPLPPPETYRQDCVELKSWQKPVALAAAPWGDLFILDAALGRFIKYSPADGSEVILGGGPDPRLLNLAPSTVEIDARGVVFVAASSPAKLLTFDADGGFLGETPLPPAITAISGIGFDAHGGVYLGTNAGLARLTLNRAPVGQAGVYYSPTLDNGQPGGTWHGFSFHANLPPKTSLEVSYYASDDAALKAAVDSVLAAQQSHQHKAEAIENLLGPRWSKPEVFAGSVDALADMLLLANKGRYLWFKLRLRTFDEKQSPAVAAASVLYPRLSYLRYLPPVYREDAASAAFLERFLSLFETFFRGVDEEIDRLFRYFDPKLAPANFLPWLASWVRISVDDDLPVERVRRLIRESSSLYQRKGTPGGLVEFLEIYTGGTVTLREHARGFRPFILGHAMLGLGTTIAGARPAGFLVGDTSVLAYSILRDRAAQPSEVFESLAHRFTVLIDMDADEFQKRQAAIRRVLEEQKPAHTAATLQLASGQSFVGAARLGINATVSAAQPYQVGFTNLGEGIAAGQGKESLRLERGAWVGSGRRL